MCQYFYWKTLCFCKFTDTLHSLVFCYIMYYQMITNGFLDTQNTLYDFYASIASRVVDAVLQSCNQPCSYTTRDISFESSWPSPIHPTTMCMPRDSILGVRMTCRYRPRLNDNGLVHFAADTILGSVGTRILCPSYSQYVITKDINLGGCNTTHSQVRMPLRTTSGVEKSREDSILPATTKAAIKSTQFVEDIPFKNTTAGIIYHKPTSIIPVATQTPTMPEKMLPDLSSAISSHTTHTGKVTKRVVTSSQIKGYSVVPEASKTPNKPSDENEKPVHRIDYLFTILIMEGRIPQAETTPKHKQNKSL